MLLLRAIASRGRGAAAAVVLAAALVTAVGPAPAAAAPPQLQITSPAPGSETNNTTPVISGEIGPLEVFNWCETTVRLYAGESAEGEPLQTLAQTAEGACSWAAASAATLEQGIYTAQATGTRWWIAGEPEPETLEHEELTSPAVTFRVDTTAPAPAISSPSPGTTIQGSSLAVSGSSGTAPGDLPAVTVQVFAGSEASGTPVQAIEVQSSEGAWEGTLAGLSPGPYVLRAQQADAAGNVGTGTDVPITLVAPPLPPPPTASFSWFPEVPRVGEPVTLVASWAAAGSPVISFAWELSAGEPFRPGNPTATTTFSAPGTHVVRLQVTDALGRTGVASKTITVRHEALTLMQPFPIVRIAGRETRSGVKLTLVTVSAPVSALVTVRIRGTGIRSSSQSRLAAAGKRPAPGGTAMLSFPRFARSLKAGTVLEIRVTKSGQIGKLTRFIPRRNKLPTRIDACLTTTGKPMRCPSS